VRLLADEGVDAAIVARLRSDGYDVIYVAELSPGITDDAVLELANADERILMTADKDFGELVFRLRRVAFGVLLVRLPGLPSASKADAVAQVIGEHGEEMPGAFTVLSAGLVRIRPPLWPRLT
jgi:predicted nuclease of predicted toxin-antitoxin system